MAEIWVPNTCTKCGQQVIPGEKAVLIAVVKTTPESTYQNYRSQQHTQSRVNFYTGSDRQMQHVDCHKSTDLDILRTRFARENLT